MKTVFDRLGVFYESKDGSTDNLEIGNTGLVENNLIDFVSYNTNSTLGSPNSTVNLLESLDTNYVRSLARGEARTATSVAHAASPYTIVRTDLEINANATAGAITVNLPAANDYSGRTFLVRKVDSSANAVTVTAAGTDTYQPGGGTSVVLKNQGDEVQFTSDGTSIWYVVTNGNLTATGFVFLGAHEALTDSANLALTRNAQGDWSLNRTAAGAETYHIAQDISAVLQQFTTANKGAEITSIDVVEEVGVVALTSNAVALTDTVYANNVANAVTTHANTGTPPTATQANPYVTNYPITTPAFMTTAKDEWIFESTVVMANTGTYRYYGIGVNYTYALGPQ